MLYDSCSTVNDSPLENGYYELIQVMIWHKIKIRRNKIQIQIQHILIVSPCYRSVCDRFNVGRATTVRAVRRVTHAVFRKSAKFIQWPSGDRAVSVMRGFEEANGFPKTIGAIDGTHIRIDAPKENPADYVNRKGFHSIQLQIEHLS